MQRAADLVVATGSSYRRWIWRSVFVLVLFCILLEAVTRLGFGRISHIESRIATEYRAATQLSRTPDKTTFLLLGNSLPLEAIDVDQLNRSIGEHGKCVRFVIEATEYLDWYYGIQRLFAKGSDPDVVLLSIDATHLKSHQIRGDYSAHYLFRTRDIPQIGREASYDLTKTAGLLLARYSLFYAGRNGIRNFILNHVNDPYAEMVRDLPKVEGRSTAASMNDGVEALDTERLRTLRELCARSGKRFILLIPPGAGHSEQTVQAAAKASGTDVLIPVHENEYPASQFRDGYHLTPQAAVDFTNRVAAELNDYLRR